MKTQRRLLELRISRGPARSSCTRRLSACRQPRTTTVIRAEIAENVSNGDITRIAVTMTRNSGDARR